MAFGMLFLTKVRRYIEWTAQMLGLTNVGMVQTSDYYKRPTVQGT